MDGAVDHPCRASPLTLGQRAGSDLGIARSQGVPVATTGLKTRSGRRPSCVKMWRGSASEKSRGKKDPFHRKRWPRLLAAALPDQDRPYKQPGLTDGYRSADLTAREASHCKKAPTLVDYPHLHAALGQNLTSRLSLPVRPSLSPSPCLRRSVRLVALPNRRCRTLSLSSILSFPFPAASRPVYPAFSLMCK